jgi:hypothetical protein
MRAARALIGRAGRATGILVRDGRIAKPLRRIAARLGERSRWEADG